jgi:hypothetical protein
MSSNSSKLGSTRSRTISKKHNGAYVVAREEGNVTRICWLHVVKGDPLKHFVAESDRAREGFEAAITDVIGDAHDLPGLRNDVTDYGWSMKRVLKDTLER